MNVEHHIASRLATTKEAEALIADDLRRALEQAFREGQLVAPSAANPYAPPQPKPAWHDALAVMARCSNAPEGHREPFIRSDATHDVWVGEAGRARTDDLRDVTPLAEAKVTDEMVERATRAVINWEYRPRLDTTITLDLGDKGSRALVNNVLTAALGLETT